MGSPFWKSQILFLSLNLFLKKCKKCIPNLLKRIRNSRTERRRYAYGLGCYTSKNYFYSLSLPNHTTANPLYIPIPIACHGEDQIPLFMITAL
jgi:hypothetical protein